MKAWHCGKSTDLDDLILQDMPRPEGEVVIRTRAAAVNFSDLLMVQDEYQIKPTRPFIPGQEIAGDVISAPYNSGFSKGDRVTCKTPWGGFAEQVSVSANMLIRIPADLPYTTAAALPVSYTTAMVALTECVVLKPSDTVLVHAASGAAGLAAVEVARAMGARVIATASSAEKRTIAILHGAELAIDYTAKDWVQQVKDATNGAGANIIFDPVGGEIGENSLHAIARNGTLLVVGFASGKIANFPGNLLLLKRAAAKGVYWDHEKDPEMLERCTTQIMTMLAQGKLNPEIQIYSGLDALPDALTALRNRQSIGKLVLSF